MSTVTPTKSVDIELLALQQVASNTDVPGTPVDVSTVLSAMIGIHFGRRATSALSASAVIRIEASTKASGDGHWFTLFAYTTGTAAANSQAVTGTVNSGQKVVTIGTTTGFTVGNLAYIENTTLGNSEFVRIKSSVASTSFTIEDDLAHAQTGSTCYNQAEIAQIERDLSNVSRIRAFYDGSQTGQATAVEVRMTTLDSLVAA